MWTGEKSDLACKSRKYLQVFSGRKRSDGSVKFGASNLEDIQSYPSKGQDYLDLSPVSRIHVVSYDQEPKTLRQRTIEHLQ